MKYFKNTNDKMGFTLLLAVLITSIILGMSVGISIFVIRELLISSIGRESQKAFFAADSGVECALYWDLKQNAFATDTPACQPNTISCTGNNYSVGGGCLEGGISEFTLTFTNGACTYVKVDKTILFSTKIDSAGHNTCNLSDRKRVERALRVSY